MEEQFYGVTCLFPDSASRGTYQAIVDGPSGPVFEEYFPDGELAALVRELVLLSRGTHGRRNFQDLKQEDVCQRLHRLLLRGDRLGTAGALSWLVAVPMGEDAFRSSVARASRPHDLPLLERALKTFDQRLSTEPAHHEALRERGFTLALLDRHEEALDSFVAAASQRPEDAAVQLAAARSLAELKRTR